MDSGDAHPGNTTAEQPPADQPGSSKENPEEHAGRFECNICLDTAKDAVVSLCGHLFCWPCLSQWLDTRPNRQLCPVCKSAISNEKVIPIYGRGGNTTDPRKKVPPRPRGQRTEAPPASFPGFQWGNGEGGGNVQFSFGIGIFPLSLFASWAPNLAGGAADGARGENSAEGSREQAEGEFLSNALLYLGIFFILWLIFV